MCLKSSEPFSDTNVRSPSYCNKRESKKLTHVRIFSLTRRRLQKKMVMRNLKLFVENQSIMQENEALKKKALLLHRENRALFSLLQSKLSSVSASS